MRIFLDTANSDEIRTAVASGVLGGVTTNPSILARENQPFADSLQHIAHIIGDNREMLVEVLATETDDMVREARELSALTNNVIIKIPMTPAGIAAAAILKTEGIKTAVTLIFSANQAVLAANAGATYVAPFVGRLDDITSDGVGLVEHIRHMFDIQGVDTQILAASVRSPQSVHDLFSVGCHVITMPASVFHAMYTHPLTTSGLEKFLSDAQNELVIA